jgi:hypothetical protein
VPSAVLVSDVVKPADLVKTERTVEFYTVSVFGGYAGVYSINPATVEFGNKNFIKPFPDAKSVIFFRNINRQVSGKAVCPPFGIF